MTALASELMAVADARCPRSRSGTQALLLGYYGARNVGDMMMGVCLLPWLRAQGVDVTVVSENPTDTESFFQAPTVHNTPLLGQWSIGSAWARGRARALLGAIARTDVLVVGGGELIRDDIGWKVFSYTIEKLVAAMLLGKPVVLVNVGIVEPRTRWGRTILRLVLPRCARIIVRDARSLRVCRELGAGAVTEFRPEIALTLPLVDADVHASRPDTADLIVVSLRKRPNDFGTYPFGAAEVTGLARALDREIERTNARVVFVPFQDDPESGDNQMHARVMAAMARRDRAELRRWTGSIEELALLFRRARCVVAMRLHAAVLAVSQLRPVVVLPYDRKVREFSDLADIGDRVERAQATDDVYIAACIAHAQDAALRAAPRCDVWREDARDLLAWAAR